MKNITIGKAERRRYKLMVWQAIGFALFIAFILFTLELSSVYIGLTAGMILYTGLVSSRIAQLIYYR